jgi:phosphoribosyl-ATP pyrophosphohydrolase
MTAPGDDRMPSDAVNEAGDDTLARLAAVIAARRGSDPDKSYVARLLAKGQDAVLKKVGEEATEVVLASKDGAPDRVVAEMADLWFHSMLVLAWHGLEPAHVLAELRRREGESGLEEFARRKLAARERGE